MTRWPSGTSQHLQQRRLLLDRWSPDHRRHLCGQRQGMRRHGDGCQPYLLGGFLHLCGRHQVWRGRRSVLHGRSLHGHRNRLRRQPERKWRRLCGLRRCRSAVLCKRYLHGRGRLVQSVDEQHGHLRGLRQPWRALLRRGPQLLGRAHLSLDRGRRRGGDPHPNLPVKHGESAPFGAWVAMPGPRMPAARPAHPAQISAKITT